MKAGMVLLIAAGFFVLSLYSVSAHFVCGQVLDSGTNVSASWFNVRVFYPATPAKFTTCQVSPQDNKYCCDVQAIDPSGNPTLGKTWEIGDTVNAFVYEPQLDYVAGPVSVKTTGQGYDVFPEMQIKKVIEIYSPNKSLIISNASKVFLNSSFLSPYNLVNFSSNSSGKVLCSNCTNFSKAVNASYGTNHWKIQASFGNYSFFQEFTFSLIKSFDFNREFKCNGCRNGRIPQKREIAVQISLNLSNAVSGMQLSEYVPSDFNITDTSGTIEAYSPGENVIVWNVSGKNIKESYTIVSPKVSPFSYSSAIFKTELEGQAIDSENVSVKGVLGVFPGASSGFGGGSVKGKVFPIISPNNPYVTENNKSLQKLAFFPNSTFNNVRFSLVPQIPPDKLKNAIGYYSVLSNIDSSNINHTYIDFKVSKSLFSNPSDLLLFGYNQGWNRQNLTFYKEDNNSYYFRGFFTGNAIAIVNDNQNLLQRFLFFKNSVNPDTFLGGNLLGFVFGNGKKLLL